MKFFERLMVEKRKIRWSNLSKTTRVFFSTILMIIVLTIIVVSFSYAVQAILNVL